MMTRPFFLNLQRPATHTAMLTQLAQRSRANLAGIILYNCSVLLVGLGSWSFKNIFRFRFPVRMPHFYSLLTFFPRTLCTITWVCLGAALGEYEEHKQNQLPTTRPTIPTPTNKPNHTNNTNNTRNTTTTNNTNTTTTNPNHIADAFSVAFARLRFIFWAKKWPRRFYQNPFYVFFPAPSRLFFHRSLFLLTYLSCSPC